MLIFVDANVFIRLFAELNDESQVEQAEQLLLKAQRGEVDLVTGPPVFFEIAWVLGQRYKVKNDKVLDILEAILSYPNLRVLDKEHVITAISIARTTNSVFADSYIAASVRRVQADNMATFNRQHFSRLGVELYPLEGEL